MKEKKTLRNNKKSKYKSKNKVDKKIRFNKLIIFIFCIFNWNKRKKERKKERKK